MAVGTLKLLAKLPKVPAALWQEMAKKPCTTNHIRPTAVGVFILPSAGRVPGLTPPTPTMARQPAIRAGPVMAAELPELC